MTFFCLLKAFLIWRLPRRVQCARFIYYILRGFSISAGRAAIKRAEIIKADFFGPHGRVGVVAT